MMNFSWSPEYSVNNPVLDDHHRTLFNLFNEAYKLVIEDASAPNTIKLISELRVYAIFHFLEEEKRMAEANYPGLEDQINEHKTFIAQVEAFKSELSTNTKETNEEIFLFLSDWLVNHIQKKDMQYKDLI